MRPSVVSRHVIAVCLATLLALPVLPAAAQDASLTTSSQTGSENSSDTQSFENDYAAALRKAQEKGDMAEFFRLMTEHSQQETARGDAERKEALAKAEKEERERRAKEQAESGNVDAGTLFVGAMGLLITHSMAEKAREDDRVNKMTPQEQAAYYKRRLEQEQTDHAMDNIHNDGY